MCIIYYIHFFGKCKQESEKKDVFRLKNAFPARPGTGRHSFFERSSKRFPDPSAEQSRTLISEPLEKTPQPAGTTGTCRI
jgi:hypothetical protein